MLYWDSKFKNLSPWPLPVELPNDALELARMAIERITCADRASEVKIYDTVLELPESEDKTWIVSATSPQQRGLLTSWPKVHKMPSFLQ
jgi:signaling intermediate in Toll pathway protein